MFVLPKQSITLSDTDTAEANYRNLEISQLLHSLFATLPAIAIHQDFF